MRKRKSAIDDLCFIQKLVTLFARVGTLRLIRKTALDHKRWPGFEALSGKPSTCIRKINVWIYRLGVFFGRQR